MEYFVKCFGDKIYKYFILFFIRKDDFDVEEKELKDYLKIVFVEFKKFVEKCDGRVIVFNNRFKGE